MYRLGRNAVFLKGVHSLVGFYAENCALRISSGNTSNQQIKDIRFGFSS
jgi:hypothetical protein